MRNYCDVIVGEAAKINNGPSPQKNASVPQSSGMPRGAACSLLSQVNNALSENGVKGKRIAAGVGRHSTTDFSVRGGTPQNYTRLAELRQLQRKLSRQQK